MGAAVRLENDLTGMLGVRYPIIQGASGVIDSVPPVREFIETMIKGAEEIMAEFKQWGMLDL